MSKPEPVCRGICKLIEKFDPNETGNPVCSRCDLKMPIEYIDNHVCKHKCICCGESVTLI